MSAGAEKFEGWAILELMGHRKLAGYLREQDVAGAAFISIDVPGPDGASVATQFYAPGAVYCITPTTEDLARRVARASQPGRRRPRPRRATIDRVVPAAPIASPGPSSQSHP